MEATRRLPLWALLAWWATKGLGLGLVAAVRHWPATLVVVVVLWLWAGFGWWGPLLPLAPAGAVLLVWWVTHPASFGRWCWSPVLGRWRRRWYDRRWWSAMSTAGLVVCFNGHKVLPILTQVRSGPAGDVLTVRMVTGQVPEDYAAVAERFAHTFAARAVRVHAGNRPELVQLTFLRGDPLAKVVPALPITATPDFAALPMGLREDGGEFLLRLTGSQVLVAGATGSGKGSVIWSFIAALAGGIGGGSVQLWGFDPKGGMELGPGLPLFDQLACDDYQQMANLLDHAVDLTRDRAARLRGITRQHTPSADEPLIVIVVDELAALTAYLSDRRLKERIRNSLGVLLTQGRAVGVHVLAAVQDPRKEVLPFRDLFTTRIGLRMAEPAHVDLVLGDGARDLGAWCDHIPATQPGTGYVVLDGDPTPVRVRFAFHTDEQIRDLARTYGRLRVIDSTITNTADANAGGEADADLHRGRRAA
jgi:S-DNA-T family DNA segregation ATPase FtsK/SpoIIIE